MVTIVIPHKGDDATLFGCLQALREQSYPQSLLEVLVVLNEPNRRNLEGALADNEILLWEPRYFSYNARNRGVQQSRGDILAFTDSDTKPDRHWVSKGVRALASQNADLVAGHIDVQPPFRRSSAPAIYEQLYAFDQEKNVRGGYSTTANLFVARHLLGTLGAFEETALTGEDFEWTKTVVSIGARLVYEPNAVVTHPARETWSELLTKVRRTSIPYSGAAQKDFGETPNLRNRVVFQLRNKPSPSKRAALTAFHCTTAVMVRIVLLAYRAFCLLGLSPRFRADLEQYREHLMRSAASAQKVTL